MGKKGDPGPQGPAGPEGVSGLPGVPGSEGECRGHGVTPAEGLAELLSTDASVSLQVALGSLDLLGQKERQVSSTEGAASSGDTNSFIWCSMTRKTAAGLDPCMGKRR